MAAPEGVPFEAVCPQRSRRRSAALVVTVAAVVAAIVGVAAWWWNGGTHLSAGGGGIGAPAPVGVPISIGIDLVTSSGPSVILDKATVPAVPGARVKWAIYRNGAHQDGFGSWTGPLAPTYQTFQVHGYSVAQPAGHPERGATWLIMTVVTSRPGVYHLNRVSIGYHSGLRSRHADGHAGLCLLAYPPADKSRVLAELTSLQPGATPLGRLDPLVVDYQACLASP